jgi:LPXTG-motif cell wall-anchored protein
MQKTIGIILIIAAFVLGYFGIQNLNEKTADFKIGEVEVTAKTSESKNKGYALLGAGALCLIAGALLVGKAKK